MPVPSPVSSPPERSSVPTATYRVQFHKDFTFRHALELVDYLDALGMSHLYASPLLTARPGSTHGYDIVSHHEINPEIGTPEEFDALVEALHRRGMGLILDIVPNHMSVGGKDNIWWLDVLEWGEESPYARYFDIHFHTHRRGLRGKVLIPVLGDQYGKVLEKGEIQLSFDPVSATFSAWYFQHRFPIDPRDYPRILEATAEAIPSRLMPLTEKLIRLSENKGPGEVYPVGQRLKAELKQIITQTPPVAAFLERAAQAMNGQPGNLQSWMKLHALLEGQSYRPAYWRVASEEINYRRFFNIDDLAGVRVELPEVFEETHRLLLDWYQDGRVDGLRVDHIDGLFNPKQYCERLQAQVTQRKAPAYVVVEKILATHEHLPNTWPIAGTTGYDTLNLINGLFVDSKGEKLLDRFYRRFTGRTESFETILLASKKRIMQVNLASEMNMLADEFHRLSSASLPTRDFTLRGIRGALEDVFAQFPVYRTYVTPEETSAQDRRDIDWAVARAKKVSSAADTSVYDFIHAVLTGDLAKQPGQKPEEVYRTTMRAQQISGPVMAKGMEDTAFYRYVRLISLNEVGGDPKRFGVGLDAFHRANQERLRRWPTNMLAGSTHDTKRGEDARARINVLSELPGRWAHAVLRWSRINRSRKVELEVTGAAPHPNDEYLFYQSLIGAWPIDLKPDNTAEMSAFAGRMDAFMIKALREGKEHSSWNNPNTAYEDAVSQFVRSTLEASPHNPFPATVAAFVDGIARFGAINSLSQTLLRLTIPGVPDTYRGCELWDFSLVDPDNRRPVDFEVRRRLLSASPICQGEEWKDGREKLQLIRSLLHFRRAHPLLFQSGSYEPLTATGAHADNVCAFLRVHQDTRLVVVTPRLSTQAIGEDTTLELPTGRYQELISGRTQRFEGKTHLTQILANAPVAAWAQVG